MSKLPDLFNVETEAALLGDALTDPCVVLAEEARVTPAHFKDRRYRHIWAALQALPQADLALGTVLELVCDELERRGQLEEVGGMPTLVDAINQSNAPMFRHHADGVLEYALRRAMMRIGTAVASGSYKPIEDILELITKSGADLAHLSQEATRKIVDKGGPALRTMTADEILTTEWPEPIWAIPGILPVGLTLFAGRPKLGKSWLLLQLAQAVAAGGMVFGQKLEPGPVLFLALEDSERRLKERMQLQHWPPGLPVDFLGPGQFTDQIGGLRDGGGDRLARQIEDKGYRLVAIDTLSRAGLGDQLKHEEMIQALIPVQNLANRLNFALVMCDHHRKPGTFNLDVISDILGSTAKGAICDTAWGLYRERGKAGAKLGIVGRDVEEQMLALSWDRVTGCWQYEGDAGELEITERRQEILNALGDLGTSAVGDIADAVGQPKSNTHNRLQDLVNAGLVLRKLEGRRVFYEMA